VAVNKNHERIVGRAARNQAIVNPENTVFQSSAFMGRKFNDPEVQPTISRVPYKISEASNAMFADHGWQGVFSPGSSAMISRKLKKRCRNLFK